LGGGSDPRVDDSGAVGVCVAKQRAKDRGWGGQSHGDEFIGGGDGAVGVGVRVGGVVGGEVGRGRCAIVEHHGELSMR